MLQNRFIMIFGQKNTGFICALLLMLGEYGYAQQTGSKSSINFNEVNINVAMVMAKQQHKPVFVDAYAVWCAPCQQLKKKTFKDKILAAYFNSHFVNISVDVEKGDGERFADLYTVNSYPTLLFIDENGKILKRIEGFVDAKSLQETAATIK